MCVLRWHLSNSRVNPLKTAHRPSEPAHSRAPARFILINLLAEQLLQPIHNLQPVIQLQSSAVSSSRTPFSLRLHLQFCKLYVPLLCGALNSMYIFSCFSTADSLSVASAFSSQTTSRSPSMEMRTFKSTFRFSRAENRARSRRE